MFKILSFLASWVICNADVLPMCCHTGIYLSVKNVWKVQNIHLIHKTLRRSSTTHFQKQPGVFYKKSVLKNFHYRKTPVMESLSNKVADLKACQGPWSETPIPKCFPVSIAKSLSTSILKIICKQLLLPLTY